AQGIDHLPILPERPGPPVRKDQRLGIGPLVALTGAHVDEGDRATIDFGAELRICVDGAFLLAPVVAVDPVGHQFLEVSGIGAVLPVFVGEVVGPARELEAHVQIVEHFIGHIDVKWFHLVFLVWLLGRRLRKLHGHASSMELPRACYARSDLKPARTSSEKILGCSQAAKWPPWSTLLKWT